MGSDHPTATKGDERVRHQKENFLMSCVLNRSVKIDWQCGQQAKHNRRGLECQCDIGYK